MPLDLVEMPGDGYPMSSANGFVELDSGVNLPQEDMNRPPVGGEYAPGVSLTELPNIVKSAIDQAIDYSEEDLAGIRISEQAAYDGTGFEGDDKLDDSRSKFVSRDVRDTIKAVLPSILRVFFAGKNAVGFDPVGAEDEAFAKQATDYVNKIVLRKDNQAFVKFYDIFHDALLKALGTVHWYWNDDYKVFGQEYQGLTFEQYVMVTQPMTQGGAMPQGLEVTNANATSYMDPQFGELYDCQVQYKQKKGGKVTLMAIPPEERIIDRRARSIDESRIYGRRRVLTVSEVVAMGYDYNQVVRMGGSENLDTNEEQVDRYNSLVYDPPAATTDPSMRTLEYCDIYLRVDLDGDGFAELYRIACGGTRYTILEYNQETKEHPQFGRWAIQLADEIPYAEFCPDPVPHLATGNSLSCAVQDIQKIKSNLIRGTLDSLSRSIYPREEVVTNQVNMNDIMNPEIGAIVRVRAPGMIREIATTFMGKECLPVLGYMDEVKTKRTGIGDATLGLDPAALQSTTPVAAGAIVAASQMQIEMIARLFAEGGMTRMFKGILKLIKTHQDKPRTVQMNGAWAAVDPAAWNAGMDATVITAIGQGREAEQLATLSLIAEKQENILREAGPLNPLCTFANYGHTLREMIHLGGFPNAEPFFLSAEQGQLVEEFQQKMQELEQQVQSLTQEKMGLQIALDGHNDAEDDLTGAKALKERTVALGNVVDAAQTAAEIFVPPNAVIDEVTAVGPYLQ